MREFVLERAQVVRRSPEEVFAFFSNAENLGAITPPWVKFRITSARPIHMRAGTIIDYSLRLHGIPVRWKSEITAWEPPVDGKARFVDEQRKGPYRYWIHEHRFASVPGDAGATLVSDFVRYAVPGGAIPHALFVRPQLKKIFDYREETTRRLMTGNTNNLPG